MSLTLKTSVNEGPYYRPTQQLHVVTSLTSLLQTVRFAFEDRLDAVAVYRNNKAIAIWVREPDYDCDFDGCYELAVTHQRNNYIRYSIKDKDPSRFWHLIDFYFGVFKYA